MTVPVSHLMTADPITLTVSDTVADAMALMDKHSFRHIPIVDGEDLVGVVSHRDLARAVLGHTDELPFQEQRQVFAEVSIDEVMVRGVATVAPNDALKDATYLMLENKFGCLPVCEGTRLVGILTESDFVRRVAESL